MKNLPTNTSIDPKEVAHFQRFSETWWEPNGPFWPLHTLNTLRIQWIIEQLQKSGYCSNQDSLPLAGLSVLDVGCGGGILSESLARLGASVTGIDVVNKNIQVARAHAANAGLDINYQIMTAESLRETNQRFDLVFNMEVVEHVANLNTFISTCNALVKPSGATFIATINRNWLSWLVAIIGAEYILRWLPKGTHHYHMLRKPAEINTLLMQDNFVIKNTVGITVNPFNRKMKITNVLLVNYMLYAIQNSKP